MNNRQLALMTNDSDAGEGYVMGDEDIQWTETRPRTVNHYISLFYLMFYMVTDSNFFYPEQLGNNDTMS